MKSNTKVIETTIEVPVDRIVYQDKIVYQDRVIEGPERIVYQDKIVREVVH